jgi:hypothetical protein
LHYFQVNVYNMGVYSRQGVEKSLKGVTLGEFEAHSPVPPTVPHAPFTLDFRLSRFSTFPPFQFLPLLLFFLLFCSVAEPEPQLKVEEPKLNCLLEPEPEP